MAEPVATRYDLSGDVMNQRIEQLLAAQPPTGDGDIFCYRFDNQDLNMANVARTIECQVFEKAFNNDPREMAEIYGPYEDASIFFLSVDASTHQACGALRVIENSSAGLMTFNDLPAQAATKNVEQMMSSHAIDSLDDCWDVGTVAVLPDYRKRNNFEVSVQLYRSLYVSAMSQKIKHFVSIIDDKPYKTMTQYLGIPFKPLNGTTPFAFEGSNQSHAVHGYVPDFYKSMNRRRYTTKGWLARRALSPLVKGTRDSNLMFDTRY